MNRIYHITRESEWTEAQVLGRYEASAFAKEGFIHCSDIQQVIRVANFLYRGQSGLILLHIDPAKLSSRLVYENLEGGAEVFPHVYGAINLDALVAVTLFEPGSDGKFDHQCLGDSADHS